MIGILLGIALHLAGSAVLRGTGVFSVATIVVDQDGVVPAISRATRQFTDERHFGREKLLGYVIVLAGAVIVVVSVVLLAAYLHLDGRLDEIEAGRPRRVGG